MIFQDAIKENCLPVTCLKNVLFSQIVGTWYFLYHLPSEDDDNLECPTCNYGVPVGNSTTSITSGYDKR